MRKNRKPLLIAAGILCAAGLALMAGAWVAGGFDIEALSTAGETWTKTETSCPAEAAQAHSRIAVRTQSGDVRIEPADGDAIELEYWTGNAQTVQVTDESGVLTVEVADVEAPRHLIVFSPGAPDTTTVVRVPASFTGEIDVESDLGEVAASDLTGLSRMQASSDGGSVVLDAVGAQHVQATSDVGDILLSGITADGIEARNTDGTVSVGGATADKLDVTNENGDVLLGSVTAATLTCTNANGDVTSQELDIATATFRTSNGDMHLAYSGSARSYAIDAHTDNGDITAPRGAFDAERVIHAQSANGSIEITFSDDE